MKDLHFHIEIAAAPETVWAALTQKEGVATLYFGSRLETSFERGAPYRYVGPDGKGTEAVHVEGEILACEAGACLQLTHRAGALWRKGPKVFTSRLTYTLERRGGETRLSVTQDAWEEGDPGHGGNLEGWPVFLANVKRYVETGKSPDLPQH